MSDVEAAFVGAVVGFLVAVFIFIVLVLPDIALDEETGNDICKQLTNSSAPVARSEFGKLICTVPSYDSTQNIIIKTNNDEG